MHLVCVYVLLCECDCASSNTTTTCLLWFYPSPMETNPTFLKAKAAFEHHLATVDLKKAPPEGLTSLVCKFGLTTDVREALAEVVRTHGCSMSVYELDEEQTKKIDPRRKGRLTHTFFTVTAAAQQAYLAANPGAENMVRPRLKPGPMRNPLRPKKSPRQRKLQLVQPAKKLKKMVGELGQEVEGKSSENEEDSIQDEDDSTEEEESVVETEKLPRVKQQQQPRLPTGRLIVPSTSGNKNQSSKSQFYMRAPVCDETSSPTPAHYHNQANSHNRDSRSAMFLEDTDAESDSGELIGGYTVAASDFDTCMYELAALVELFPAESRSRKQREIKEGVKRAVRNMDRMRTSEGAYRKRKWEEWEEDVQPTASSGKGKEKATKQLRQVSVLGSPASKKRRA
ncbi:hypothetical protein MIND_00921200 [Mycena indigotica]|uniref:Uncharacterized protein n=1 Tax=Mycena indigotica TaxID=2126181 RepID=A0A8H6VWR9_9AGAR|nr:uncharacterized protein MIND_00921200 [Mycena indigotica]KAF7296894.1 hypothetical protein MIND_00921200 [Mycena indigotica]